MLLIIIMCTSESLNVHDIVALVFAHCTADIELLYLLRYDYRYLHYLKGFSCSFSNLAIFGFDALSTIKSA